MVGINPSIKYQKTNFGAYDTLSPQTSFMPATDIPDDPYTAKHGSTLKDHRNLLPKLELPSRNLMPEYDSYENNHSKSEHSGSKKQFLKTFLTLGGLAAAGILIFKKRKNITNAVKNLFKKKNADAATETSKIGTKLEQKRISTFAFKKYYEEATAKAYIEENLDALKIENLQVIMNSKVHSVADKKKHLKNLYELGQIYNYKDGQAKITLMMPESIKDHADDIVNMFAKNRIDEVDDKLIEKIEGFKILNEKRGVPDQYDMIVDSQVRHGVNAKDIEDVTSKKVRDISDFFRNRL